MSQVLNQFIDWNVNSSKAGLIPFPKPLLVAVMEKLSEDEVIAIAKQIAITEVRDIVLLLRQRHTLESFLEVYEAWVRAAGFALRKQNDENGYQYVLQHDMSKKWSLYLAELFRNVFEGFEKHSSFEITSNSVVFTVHD